MRMWMVRVWDGTEPNWFDGLDEQRGPMMNRRAGQAFTSIDLARLARKTLAIQFPRVRTEIVELTETSAEAQEN